MSLARRLHRAEDRTYKLMVRHIMDEGGLTGRVEDFLDEVEAFFALPLAEQLAEVDRIRADMEAAGVPWAEGEHVKAELVRLYRR